MERCPQDEQHIIDFTEAIGACRPLYAISANDVVISIEQYILPPDDYGLMTFDRPSNADDPALVVCTVSEYYDGLQLRDDYVHKLLSDTIP